MMMHCLEAGGLNPVWDSERDQWASEQGMEVNPGNKMREITDATLASFAYNPAQYEGRLIKLITKYGYLRLPKWDYKVVLMVRDPEEIRQSFARVFDKPLTYTGDNGEQVPLTNELYYHIISGVADDLDKQNIRFTPFNSRMVLERPLAVFRYLKNNGWPIDPERAAVVVQPQHQHVLVN
jgi:hypothetical protein